MEEDINVYIPKKYEAKIMARFDCEAFPLDKTSVFARIVSVLYPLCKDYIIRKGVCILCPFGEWAKRIGVYNKYDAYYCVDWIDKILSEKHYFKSGMIDVIWEAENHDKAVKQLNYLRKAFEKYIVFTD